MLSDDQRTIIFKPDDPFALGDTVSVLVASGLISMAGQAVEGTSFSFQIASQKAPKVPPALNEVDPQAAQGHLPASAGSASQTNSSFLTLPSGFPSYTVTVPANGTGSGDLFIAPIIFATGTGLHPYLLILNDSGEPVFHMQMPLDSFITDFKRQPSGLLTYYDSTSDNFKVLDSSYSVVDTFQAGNGYSTDVHDLQILPDGHALLMIYDPQIVDMSQIAAGGYPTATVLGLVVQELDSTKNVVFQWRSWDHFNITDTFELTNTPLIDYVHGNAIDKDQDGNLLISSRNMSRSQKSTGKPATSFGAWEARTTSLTLPTTRRCLLISTTFVACRMGTSRSGTTAMASYRPIPARKSISWMKWARRLRSYGSIVIRLIRTACHGRRTAALKW